MRLKQPLRKNDGFTLIWVLCIFLVITLSSVVIISSASITMRSTDMQYNAQQAYFSARSAANAAANYIMWNVKQEADLENIIASPGTGSKSELGNYTVNVEYTDLEKTKVKVTATANFRGEERTVAVHLKKLDAPITSVIPTDKILYFNGGTASIGQSIINGDIYVDGPLSVAAGTQIIGSIITNGTFTLTGDAVSTTQVISYGNLKLSGSGKLACDVYTKGDLTIDGNTLINGNVFVDGSINMTKGSGKISGNAVVGHSASFGWTGSSIGGSLSYGVSYTYPKSANINSIVLGGLTKIENYTPLDFTKYTAPPLNIVYPPTVSENPKLYTPVIVNNHIISDSGMISATTFSASYGTVTTIDATMKDIYLLLKDTNLSLSTPIIEVVGSHNVYLYMTGNSSINSGGNEIGYIGVKTRTAAPQLFVFGDGAQSISLNNTSMNACVYIPLGSMTITGASTDRFWGTCIVKSADIDSDVKIYQKEPILTNTPLETFDSQINDSNKDDVGWVIESWNNK